MNWLGYFFIVHLVNNTKYCSFAELNATCIERTSDKPWKVVADRGYDANCALNADFVLIFTSNLDEIEQATSEVRHFHGTFDWLHTS